MGGIGSWLKGATTVPRSIRKFQPKKLGNVSWWKEYGRQVALPAAKVAAYATGAGALTHVGLNVAGRVLSGSGDGGGGKGGGGGGNREKTYRDKFDAGIEGERARGDRFSGEYEERALNYDANDAARKAIAGTAAIEMPRLQASQVSRGRAGTGFGFEEEDEYMANLMASKTMEGERMNFENMRDIGGYGERARDRVYDADFGRYSTERMAREQKAASKRDMWGNIISGGLSAAGQIMAAKAGGGSR